MGWVFTALPDGGIRVSLGGEERSMLQTLPQQLETVLREAPGDPVLKRLAPPAYADDPEHEAEYRAYMGDDLRQRQLAALTLLGETAGAERLDEEQAHGWMSALTSMRLVLGTQLDVQEDDDLEDVEPEDERAPMVALYHYLSLLLDELVTALSAGLPEVADEP